ncbi:MAG: hypothetical protein H7231_08765 [Rhodoferax sp.]|nr:hypothetical protein [Actinomycetota bacterium]
MTRTTSGRLSRPGLAWRVAVTLAVVGLAVNGSVRGNDVQWPFAPMSQFACGVDLDGQIRSTYIEADTTAGTTVRVPLTAGGVGLGRAEVEGQLPRLVADPALLQSIAVAAARRHPGWPRYTKLRLRQEVSDLRGGEVVSTRTERLADWTVVDPTGLR